MNMYDAYMVCKLQQLLVLRSYMTIEVEVLYDVTYVQVGVSISGKFLQNKTTKKNPNLWTYFFVVRLLLDLHFVCNAIWIKKILWRKCLVVEFNTARDFYDWLNAKTLCKIIALYTWECEHFFFTLETLHCTINKWLVLYLSEWNADFSFARQRFVIKYQPTYLYRFVYLIYKSIIIHFYYMCSVLWYLVCGFVSIQYRTKWMLIFFLF